MTAPIVPQAARFTPWDRVTITYENRPIQRDGWIVSDDGGPKVRVRWRAQDGPRIGRHVVPHHGAEHEQMIPRGRLVRRRHR